ncbi:decaprenyl-phosphate phosphoribosyltransferase [Fictibacillus gelatini]|uniref:decaprenyl-phosphate phosphoribosyltransferase n=1 Tax=Fictibacillus gelatini TaxID=225985 RepID=UPI00040CB0B8|nr:decaprenyl-phosphate phosphoribosyltransferase [Fictibacillus gelatini]
MKWLWIEIRPKHWTKNALVFAAWFFSLPYVSTGMILKSVLAFCCFSFLSSVVYILNDIADVEVDRNHPVKRNRPIAAGKLSLKAAVIFGVVLWIVSFAGAIFINFHFAGILMLYFLLNVVYSFYWKHVPLLDVLLIASGYVFRAVGGGMASGIKLTPWFLLCTMFVALFLAISKRRSEVNDQINQKGKTRKVLEYYNKELLDQLNTIAASSVVMTYSLFSFQKGLYFMWTIPVVIMGIFRYLYVIHIENKGDQPEKVLWEDQWIRTIAMIYGGTVVILLVFFQ